MDPTVLIIDDDTDFAQLLKRGLTTAGYKVSWAETAEAALAHCQAQCPTFATLDLNLAQSSGLSVLPQLKAQCPALKIVVITGFASLTTAVMAIKAGAFQYLPKPVRMAQLLAVFNEAAGQSESTPTALGLPHDLDTLEWEQIQKTLQDYDYNITKAAQQLGLSRRTLQRKLKKRPY